ncbi:MAG: mobilization protein [Gammaproteobacteria bacterium]
MSAIHFIGGEKGGVGKSVVARLLAQYWIDQGVPWQGFDTDRSHGALLRYYAGYAEPLDTAEVTQLDRLVECALESDRRVLVDLAAQTDGNVYSWIEGGGVIDLAADVGLDLRFWHVMDDGKDSVDLLMRLLDHYNDNASFVIVLNRGRGDDFSMFHESPAAERVRRGEIPVIELRALHRQTMLRIDRHDKSFWAATQHSDGEGALGIMERQRLKVWARHAYAEFERLGV